MKKIISFIVSALMILSVVTVGTVASAADTNIKSGVCGENATWELDLDTGEMVVKGSGSITDYQKYEDSPFYKYKAQVKNLQISPNIDRIGNYAFYALNIKNVEIPDNVKSIGKFAFAYIGCMETVSFGNGLKTIEDNAFSGTGIGSITLPDGLVSIGDNAFKSCIWLREFYLPDTLERIGANAFDYTSTYNDSENWENDSLYIGDCLVSVKNTIEGDLSVRAGTRLIADKVFCNCRKITSVSLPDTVEVIGELSFQNCINLKKINLPDSLKTINGSAFFGCERLESINIPGSVEKIGDYAFAGCKSLKSAELSEGVTTISKHEFSGCVNLEKVVIPESVREIGELAFYGCQKLDGVVLPENLEVLGRYAFLGCSTLTAVKIPDKVKIIEKGTFSNCPELTDIEIGNSVESIGEGSFLGALKLEKIAFPDSVKRIENSVFVNCFNLKDIKLGNSVEYIGSQVFDETEFFKNQDNWSNGVLYINNCLIICSKDLSGSFKIKNGTKVIAELAIDGCDKIKKLTIPASVITCPNNGIIRCSGIETIDLDKNSKSFAMVDSMLTSPDKTEILCYPAGSKATELTIPSYIKNVADFTFYNSANLKRIKVSDGVETIGQEAFSGCTGVEIITVPDSVKTIGKGAFWNCASLKEITLPFAGFSKDATTSSEKTVLGYVFGDVEYKGSYKSVQFYTYNDKTTCFLPSTLEKVTITGGKILHGALYNFGSMKSVRLCGDIDSICAHAFRYCENLKEVIIQSRVKTISYNAFEKCANIESLYLPDSLEGVAAQTFNSCEKLINVNYSGSEEQWNKMNILPNSFRFGGINVIYNSVYVEPVYPTINATKLSLKSGDEKTLKITDGKVKAWKSSKQTVAKVTSNGKVYALTKGTAKITATLSDGKKLTCTVTVTTSPKLNKASITVKKGKTAAVKITGKSKSVNNSYTNTKYAKVISSKTATTIKIKGLKKGTTTLKIKVNGKALKLKVTVK